MTDPATPTVEWCLRLQRRIEKLEAELAKGVKVDVRCEPGTVIRMDVSSDLGARVATSGGYRSSYIDPTSSGGLRTSDGAGGVEGGTGGGGTFRASGGSSTCGNGGAS